MTRLVLLGSGGWVPTSSRETCCALVRNGSHALIIDAGTGMHRLLERPELVRDADQVDVILTHFHLDHVVGLAYIPALGLRHPPVIHAPGAWLYGTRSEEILRVLLGPPFLTVRLTSIVSEVREVWPGELELGGIAVACRKQDRHSAPTVGLRVGNAFAYCTDTAADPGTSDFARGARVLVHEAWSPSTRPEDSGTHTSAREAGNIAAASDVERLVLIHLPPSIDEKAVLTDARGAFPNVALGRDLDCY